MRTFDIKASNVLNDPNPEGPRYSIIAGADFNTCYFARTLEGSGSGKVDVSSQPAQAPVALPSTVEVTSTAITSEPLPSASVAMTVSTLLSNTASSRLAPVTPSSSSTRSRPCGRPSIQAFPTISKSCYL